MYAHGKSDDPIVPARRANKTGTPAAESAEERGSPKGSAVRHLLAPDTAPEFASHRSGRPRLVEILCLDRCTRRRSRMSRRSRTDLCGGPPATAVPTAIGQVSFLLDVHLRCGGQHADIDRSGQQRDHLGLRRPESAQLRARRDTSYPTMMPSFPRPTSATSV